MFSSTPIVCFCHAESNRVSGEGKHPAAQRRDPLNSNICGSRQHKRSGVEDSGFRSIKIYFIPTPLRYCYPSLHVYINTDVRSYRFLCGGRK